jgi:sugar phosphate permease
MRDVFPLLARKPTFWLMAFASSFSSMCGYGLAFWAPSFFIRSFGFDLATTSYYFGSILLIGGTIGVFAGGWFADRAGQGDRGFYARLPALAWLVCVPFFAGGFLTDNVTLAWFLFLIPNGLNILWLGPVNTAVQHLVPPHMRATASASFLLINNLIGLGAGSWVMGMMSDAMTASYGNEALRYAAVAALSFYLVAAGLMLLAVKPLRRDWVG